MSRLAFLGSSDMAVLSRLYFHGSPVLAACPASPVLAIFSWLSCPRSPVLAVLSLLSCPRSPVLAVLSSLSCPRSLFLAGLSLQSCPIIPVLASLSWQSWRSCPCGTVMAALSELPLHCHKSQLIFRDIPRSVDAR
jgi:hypothetical protein